MPIRDNFVEIKAHAKPKPIEDLVAATKAIKAMPRNRVAVLCDEHITEQGGILIAYGKYEGSMDSDSGVVVASTYKYINVGDRVGFNPMHGLRCDSDNFDWVPKGCEIRFYGVACPINDSLFVLEPC